MFLIHMDYLGCIINNHYQRVEHYFRSCESIKKNSKSKSKFHFYSNRNIYKSEIVIIFLLKNLILIYVIVTQMKIKLPMRVNCNHHDFNSNQRLHENFAN